MDFVSKDGIPRHVAIIMDGNGRWASQRGLPRSHGHKAGVKTVKEIVKAAGNIGIEYLTLFSFSSENWNRPEAEITELFSLLKMFIRRDLAELHNNNVKLIVIGEREGLPSDILPLLLDAENLTRGNTGQKLVIAFNYGSRGELSRAMQKMAEKVLTGALDPAQIDCETISQHLDTRDIPDPDLVIRTSGEKRLSNFLMWQSAYAELIFAEEFWPDFTSAQFRDCIEEYRCRTRKFGGLSQDTGS